MAKSQPKPLGAEVPSANVGAQSILGQTLSINFKRADFLETPSRKIRLDHDNPTVHLPEDEADIDPVDLQALWMCLQRGRVVQGDKPVAAMAQQPSRIQHYIDNLKLDADISLIKRLVSKVVNGPYTQGGFTKIEILERMLAAEERVPGSNRGGRNRPEVLKMLRSAIDFVDRAYGGSSGVTTEHETRMVRVGEVNDFGGVKPQQAGSSNDIDELMNV